MATVLIVLLPYLVLFYLLDSMRLVRKNHLLFTSLFGKRFRAYTSGLRFPGVSPLGQSVRSHCRPVCCLSSGIASCNTDCSSPVVTAAGFLELIDYKAINSVTVDHTSLMINGAVLFKAPTHISARHCADTIERMKDTSPGDRASRVSAAVRNSFRLERLRRLQHLYGRLLLPIRFLCTVLFLLMFILLPACLFTGLSAHVRLGVVMLDIAFIYVLTVLFSYYIYRKIYRCGRKRGLLFAVLLVFSPLSALHVPSLLSTDLYHRFDYLTVSAALTKKERFSSLAAAELRKIQYAFVTSGPQELRDHWMLRKQEIAHLLRKTGLDERDLMAAPPRQDPQAVAYCPVCLTEYREGGETCSDCGIELQRFEE